MNKSYFAFIILGFLLFSNKIFAQQSEHLPKDSLSTIFPKTIDGYKLDKISMAPDFVTPDNSIVLNGLYAMEGGNEFFIQLAHYQNAEQRKSANNWLEEPQTTFKGYPSYKKSDAPTVSVFVGNRFDLKAYRAGGDIDTTDLYDALKAINMQHLEKILEINKTKTFTAKNEDKEQAGLKEVDVEEVVLEEIDCSKFNDDLKEEMKKQIRAGLVPWVHFLKEKEAGSAKIEENNILFPKKGNDWLQCVKRNDIIWSPMDMPVFLLRVKAIREKPDRFIFTTENAGLNDVIIKGKIKVKADGN